MIVDVILYGPLMLATERARNMQPTIPSPLPSIQNLLPEAASFVTNYTGITGISSYPGTITAGVLGIAITLLVIPWLTGGYLGLIAQDVKGSDTEYSFIQLAHKFASRLILLQVVMVAILIVTTPLLVNPALEIILGFGVVILFIVLVFWSYAIVYDDLHIIPALPKAYRTFTHNLETMIYTLLPMALILAPLSLLTSFIMFTPLLILMIIIYAYIGAVLVSGLMQLYAKLNAAKT